MKNSQTLPTVLAVSAGLFLTINIVIIVLTGQGNVLGAVAKYISPIAFLISFVNGRIGVYLLILAMAYSDLVKRMMVLYGDFYLSDITFVLMISPLIMTGVFSHYFIARFLRGRGKTKLQDRLLIISLLGVMISGVSAIFLQSGGLFDALKLIAHKSAYIPLAWVIWVAFPTREEVVKFLKFVVIAFVPVALYGIKQGVFGFTDWELSYLLSGYSIEIKYLSENVVHAFSSMNSARAFGITMAYCVAFVFALWFTQDEKGRRSLSTSGFLLLLLMFSFACFYSAKRASWISLFAILIGLLAFGSRFRTKALYSFAAILLVLLFAFSGTLLKNWAAVNNFTSTYLPGELSISSFSARLVSLNNMITNPEMWSLFGLSKSQVNSAESVDFGTGLTLDRLSSLLAHDMFSKVLVSYGAIALFTFIIGGAITLYWLHNLPFKLKVRSQRLFFVSLLACLFGGMSSGATSGTFVFPINALLYMLIGVFLSSYYDIYKNQENNSDLNEFEKLH